MKVFVLGSFVQACCWSVPRLPLPGESLQAHAVSVEPGGKGLNVAIGLSRLGAETTTLMGCGRDAAADSLLSLLRDEGIADRHVHRFPGQSGCGAGLIGGDGQNAIAVFLGPNLELTASHAEQAAADIADSRLIYGHFETSLLAVAAAFALARRSAITTVLNPSPWQPVPACLQRDTDIVLVNEVEACDLLDLHGERPLDRVGWQVFLSAGMKAFWSAWEAHTLVVSLGALGCLAFEREGRVLESPAFPVVAVDSTGAGDAFASGFCLTWPQGLAQALRTGNACGALATEQLGVLAALPDRTRLQVFLQQYS